ncbi:MAG: hypothetical protein ACE5G7_03870 [Candidatus Hydrothermarchaeaceae archaeon]
MSPHSEEGITCDRCHGGDPTSPNIMEAHWGVLGPADPGSKIHYTTIASTCGECHTEIAAAFTQSKHYQNLMKGRLAPDCRTCMGTHDVTLDPTRIIGLCEKCMNPENGVGPEPFLKGKAAHTMMTATEKEIFEAENLVKLGRERGQNLTLAQAELEKAKAGMVGREVGWHTFNPDGLIPELMKAYHSAVVAGEIAQKALQEPSILPVSIATALIVGAAIVFGGIAILERAIWKKWILR